MGLTGAAIALIAAAGIQVVAPDHPAAEDIATRVLVTAVVDGDTLRVADLTGRELGRVRLLGIDAPEVAHLPTQAQCYAAEATALLEQLAPVGSTVELVSDRGQPDRDRYGRMLRYVDHAGTDISGELLARGAVRGYDSDQGLARGEAYAAAEDSAHATGSGLWGNC